MRTILITLMIILLTPVMTAKADVIQIVIGKDLVFVQTKVSPYVRYAINRCEPIDAVLYNLDRGLKDREKWNGWSLTGWRKTTLNDDFEVRTVKIGFINGDLYTNSMKDWELLTRWEKEQIRTPTYGICISWEF